MNTEHKSNTDASIRDLWQTPKKIFNNLNKEFIFTHDVAASDKNHLCGKWLTESDNALLTRWGKVNWCNPPYSKILPWVQKATIEHEAGKTIVI